MFVIERAAVTRRGRPRKDVVLIAVGRVGEDQIGLWVCDGRGMAAIEMYHGNLQRPDMETKSTQSTSTL